MLVLVFDTETTGLPTNNYECKKEDWHTHWGHIVQWSWILYDTEKHKVMEIEDHIIKIADDVELSDESINIHGITREKINKNGIPIKEAMLLFVYSLYECDMVLGHNVSFDVNMARAEMIRNEGFDYFTMATVKHKCTMKSTIYLCKILTTSKTGRKYYKFPKLVELHEKVFETTPRNLHDSMTDVLVCLRCYMMIENKMDIYGKTPELTSLLNEII